MHDAVRTYIEMCTSIKMNHRWSFFTFRIRFESRHSQEMSVLWVHAQRLHFFF